MNHKSELSIDCTKLHIFFIDRIICCLGAKMVKTDIARPTDNIPNFKAKHKLQMLLIVY